MYCSNCGKENLWCPVQSINIIVIVAITIVAVLLIILVYSVNNIIYQVIKYYNMSYYVYNFNRARRRLC